MDWPQTLIIAVVPGLLTLVVAGALESRRRKEDRDERARIREDDIAERRDLEKTRRQDDVESALREQRTDAHMTFLSSINEALSELEAGKVCYLGPNPSQERAEEGLDHFGAAQRIHSERITPALAVLELICGSATFSAAHKVAKAAQDTGLSFVTWTMGVMNPGSRLPANDVIMTVTNQFKNWRLDYVAAARIDIGAGDISDVLKSARFDEPSNAVLGVKGPGVP